MNKLFYLPLESYPERYTYQLSRPVDGWMERNFRQRGVNYIRVDGQRLGLRINNGVVLDACGRGYFACSQIQSLLARINAGEVTNDDVIYFEDFWTPGMEAIPYACTLMGIKPKMYAFCWAQSWDEFDFTTRMLPWIRGVEWATLEFLNGVFVTSSLLKDLIVQQSTNVACEDKIHVTGLPFCSEEVLSYCPPAQKKKNQVVYCSRIDAEKDPCFFLDVARYMLRNAAPLDLFKDDPLKFVVTTSFRELKSNNPALVEDVRNMAKRFPDEFIILENLSKKEYYQVLSESKVQFNCALQDWVSWTLLEATAHGCFPLYPNFRSFPEALRGQQAHLYEKHTSGPCSATHKVADKLISVLEGNYAPDAFDWVYRPFDLSVDRMLAVMNNKPFQPLF